MAFVVVPPTLFGEYDLRPRPHFVLTYAVPSSGLPWPLGVTLVLAPVALGVVMLRRADALTVVTGILAFFCVLSVAVGLRRRAGRPSA